MGLRVSVYQDGDNYDVFVLEGEVPDLLSDARGIWYREEWLLARVGLALSIITRAEARELARSWAVEDAPDACVLPGFLIWD